MCIFLRRSWKFVLKLELEVWKTTVILPFQESVFQELHHEIVQI